MCIRESHMCPSLTLRLHFFSHRKLMKLSPTWPNLLALPQRICLSPAMVCTVVRQPGLAIGLAGQQHQGGEQLSLWGHVSVFIVPSSWPEWQHHHHSGRPGSRCRTIVCVSQLCNNKSRPGKWQLLSWARLWFVSRWLCSWHETQIIIVYEDAFSCHLAFHCWTKRLKTEWMQYLVWYCSYLWSRTSRKHSPKLPNLCYAWLLLSSAINELDLNSY